MMIWFKLLVDHVEYIPHQKTCQLVNTQELDILFSFLF